MGTMTTTDPYADFDELTFDRPADGVLRITLDAPGLNSVSAAMHRQLADVWLAVDRDPDAAALIRFCGYSDHAASRMRRS